MSEFEVVRSRSDAGVFHASSVPEPARPELWWHEVTRPALVLGSNQDESMVDHAACERSRIQVARRRSGGGAVLLVPGEVAWLDVIIPRGGPGWSDDVHRPMVWLGEHLVAAIGAAAGASLDTDALAVHRGAMVSTPWSAAICFDGLGAGEVTVGGAKLVGISQRRTRSAARLQACWYTRYDPASLVELLADSARPARSTEDLRPVATLAETTSVLDALVDGLGENGGRSGE